MSIPAVTITIKTTAIIFVNVFIIFTVFRETMCIFKHNGDLALETTTSFIHLLVGVRIRLQDEDLFSAASSSRINSASPRGMPNLSASSFAEMSPF